MFLIHWGYALANISAGLIIYIYIGQANPGVSKGLFLCKCDVLNKPLSLLFLLYFCIVLLYRIVLLYYYFVLQHFYFVQYTWQMGRIFLI